MLHSEIGFIKINTAYTVWHIHIHIAKAFLLLKTCLVTSVRLKITITTKFAPGQIELEFKCNMLKGKCVYEHSQNHFNWFFALQDNSIDLGLFLNAHDYKTNVHISFLKKDVFISQRIAVPTL